MLPNPIRSDGSFKLERLPVIAVVRDSLTSDYPPQQRIETAQIVYKYFEFGFSREELPDMLIEANAFLSAYWTLSGINPFELFIEPENITPSRKFCERIELDGLADDIRRIEDALKSVDPQRLKRFYREGFDPEASSDDEEGAFVFEQFNRLDHWQLVEHKFWEEAAERACQEVSKIDPFYVLPDWPAVRGEEARLVDLLPNYSERSIGDVPPLSEAAGKNRVIQAAGERYLSSTGIKFRGSVFHEVLVRIADKERIKTWPFFGSADYNFF